MVLDRLLSVARVFLSELKMFVDSLFDGWFQARQTAQQKQQAAEESRKDYVTSLNQFNQDQHQHYHTLVPVIYQVNQYCYTLVLVIHHVNQY